MNIHGKFKQTEIGEIPKNWDVVKISTLFDIFAGGDLKKLNYSKTKTIQYQYPIYSNSLNEQGLYGYSNKYQYKPESITITARGETGHAEYRKEPFSAIVRLLVLLPKTKVSCKFITEYINTFLDFQYVGSAVNQLTVPMISGHIVAYPPFNDQLKIASILFSFDDKIELNKKIIKNLEQTAQALFKHWFVDFEFPNESGQPYKSSGGEMIDSELGQIPKEWNILPLTNVTHIVYGKGLPTNKLLNQGYPVFGGNGQIGFYNEYLYEEPQIIIGCRGAASGNIKQTPPKSYITNNSLVLEIPQPSMLNIFYLKQYLYRIGISEYVTGSAQPQITIENLKNCPVLIPQPKYLELFCGQIKNIDLIIKKYEKEIQLITQTRDLLLPKLLSGKIRIN